MCYYAEMTFCYLITLFSTFFGVSFYNFNPFINYAGGNRVWKRTLLTGDTKVEGGWGCSRVDRPMDVR